MNINFNFGEHYFDGSGSFWTDLLISFIGAFFGLLFALLVNRLVDKKAKRQQNELKSNQDLERLQYLLLLLKSVVKTTKAIIKSFTELSVQVKDNPFESYMPTKIASDDLKRLKNLDSIELFDSYINIFKEHKTNTAVYKSIFGQIDFISEKLDDAFKQNENYRNFKHKDELFLRDCIDEVFIRIGLRTKNYLKVYKEKAVLINEYNYLSHFEEIYGRFSENLADFKGIQDEYFKPLHDTIIDNIEDINFADPLFAIVKKALNRLFHVSFNSLEFSKDMENIEKDMQKALTYLEEQIEIIEKKIAL